MALEGSGVSKDTQAKRNKAEQDQAQGKTFQDAYTSGSLPTPTDPYYDPATTQDRQQGWQQIVQQIMANGAQQGGGPDVSGYSLGQGGGGSSGGSGGGGGGGGGVNPAYIAAMQAYLAQKDKGLGAYLSPYDTAQSGVNTAYNQSHAQIAEGGAQQAQRLAAAQQLQAQYNQQLHAAYTNPGASYDFSGLLRDLQSAGAGTGGLQAQAQLQQANQGMDASRRSTLADSLIAGRNFDNTQRADTAAQLTQGMNGQLDINHMQALAAIAKQRATAEQAYNDQLAQLHLTAAQQGIQ